MKKFFYFFPVLFLLSTLSIVPQETGIRTFNSVDKSYILSDNNVPNLTASVYDSISYISVPGGLYTSSNGGYVNGTNGYGDLGKYQRFDFNKSYELAGFQFYFGAKVINGTSDNVNIVVREVAADGAPGNLLASKTITTNDLDTTDVTLVMLNSSLTVSKPVFIGFEWETSADDLFGLISDQSGTGNGTDSRVWEKWSDGSFAQYNTSASWTLDIDLWIAALVVPGVATSFMEDFEAYTAGNMVACSNPTFWTTWSNAPCGSEDALVSSDFAYSGTKSAKIITNDDLVKDFGLALTSGKHRVSFRAYIPSGKAGYFNTLATYAGSNSTWGMECYFDANGGGRVLGGSATAVAFTYPVAAWFLVETFVNLDLDQAQLVINGTAVHTWQWTKGASGTGAPLTLDANDFFGATANDIMYIDNYSLETGNALPVELTSFSANTQNSNVLLNWTTQTELNNQGFDIEKRSIDGQFFTIGHVNGNGTTSEAKNYSFTDSKVQTGKYYYRLKQIDFNGTFEYSNEILVEVAPNSFVLDQNYPNPFNPTTTISFGLAQPTFVKLAVYNLLGEQVQLLKNENMNAGSYTVSFDASSLPSGMYLYKIETAQFTNVRKMMLMK